MNFFAGGWFGFKTLVVSKKIKETDDITSFIIQNSGGEPLPDFKPGLYSRGAQLKSYGGPKIKKTNWLNIPLKIFIFSDLLGLH